MESVIFPSSFPSESMMFDILKKTIEKSWNVELDIEDIELWLQNFTGKFFEIKAERKLALWMLCNFTYYNEDEINHLCRVLYSKLIHQLLLDFALSTKDDAETVIGRTAFTSIGRASESGGMLLYHFRQEAKLEMTRFIFPSDMVRTKNDIIICVDDVIISGNTSVRFFEKNMKSLDSKYIYYISLLATSTAIEELSKKGIHVVCCAMLDDRNKMFSEESLAFFKYSEIKDAAKKVARGYGKMLEPEMPLGYKDGQYCFGMFYNIPNNSLPIFWSEKNNWHPIFRRKEKYQNANQAKRKYSFFI